MMMGKDSDDQEMQNRDRKKKYTELKENQRELQRGLDIFSDAPVCLINSRNSPHTQRKRKKIREIRYETEKDKARISKIFLIESLKREHIADRGETVLVPQDRRGQ